VLAAQSTEFIHRWLEAEIASSHFFWELPLVEWIEIKVAGLDPTRKVSRDRIESATRNPYEESYSKGLTA
jgi:hypothetical protein